MKSTKLINLMIAACLAVLACACNADSSSSGGFTPPANTLYDFATLSSTNQDGSVFTLTKANDTELITYTCSTSLADNKNLKAGDRLVIAYTTTGTLQAYQSGPINLVGYILMNNKDMSVGEYSGTFSSSPLRMEVITRTGSYINMQMQLFARNNLSQGSISLVADPERLDAAVVELYLLYENPNNNGDNQYLAYASFDIKDIWSRSTCKGVRVNYQTPDGMKSTLFENNDIAKPEPVQ